MYRFFIVAVLSVLPVLAHAQQDPGPSQATFDHPYYTCQTNYYVTTNGNDTTGTGSSAQPWLTLQHANSVLANNASNPGVCINVAAGTYANGVNVSTGGNLASSTGYLVYRCAALDGCTITDPGYQNNAAIYFNAPYVIFDGFKLNSTPANSMAYGQGFEILGPTNGATYTPSAAHHIIIINDVIDGYGQSGVQFNQTDYVYVVHTRLHNNANTGGACNAQGSGISYNELIPLANYTRTADDANTSFLIGPLGNTFHSAVELNHVYNNAETLCQDDTDGNGINMDTLDWNVGPSNAQPYLAGVLLALNVVYNNGSAGLRIDYSHNITVANNSCYNNWLDTVNPATSRGCINSQTGVISPASANNSFFNNIVYTIPAAPGTCSGSAPTNNFNTGINAGEPTGMAADVISNNLGDNQPYPGCSLNGAAGVMLYYTENSPVSECGINSNQCQVDPLWVSVGGQSTGTETTPPTNANFALQSTSPAIGVAIRKSYLSAGFGADLGACPRQLTTCP